MKLRKLIRADVLRDMHADVRRGVPVALAMRKYLPPDSMTRPTVVKILAANNAIDVALATGETARAEHIADSLFPTWLDCTGDAVQIEPHGFSYHGMFPLGRWLCAT
jgi:hypothetical protein